MKLWSIQSKAIKQRLLAKEKYTADWSYVPSNWKSVYHWIMQEMEKSGIPMLDHPPIWAWHSVNQWQRAPDIAEVIMLFSIEEIEAGLISIELEVPQQYVLLSNYNRYCDLFFYANEIPKNQFHKFRDMFLPIDYRKDATIQATLPYLMQDWILEIKDLDIDYDNQEEQYLTQLIPDLPNKVSI